MVVVVVVVVVVVESPVNMVLRFILWAHLGD